MSEYDLPTPWNEDTFEAALQSIRRDVSLRSIQNWRSGKTRPSRQNIHAIAKVISGENAKLQKEWSESLLLALSSESEIVEHLKTVAETADTETVQESTSQQTVSNGRSRKLWGLALIGAFCVGGVSAYSLIKTKSNVTPAITISDIRFCGETDFSQETKRCLDASVEFPASIDIVYVSFETSGVPYGHPFERRWYHNGVKFIHRDGFFDEAWENYTWVKNDGLKGAGKYVLRIIVDGRTTTGYFHLIEG